MDITLLKETDRHINACLGKISHNTKSDALVALRKTRAKSKLIPYECKHCNKWHLGTIPKPRKGKMKIKK